MPILPPELLIPIGDHLASAGLLRTLANLSSSNTTSRSLLLPALLTVLRVTDANCALINTCLDETNGRAWVRTLHLCVSARQLHANTVVHKLLHSLCPTLKHLSIETTEASVVLFVWTFLHDFTAEKITLSCDFRGLETGQAMLIDQARLYVPFFFWRAELPLCVERFDLKIFGGTVAPIIRMLDKRSPGLLRTSLKSDTPVAGWLAEYPTLVPKVIYVDAPDKEAAKQLQGAVFS